MNPGKGSRRRHGFRTDLRALSDDPVALVLAEGALEAYGEHEPWLVLADRLEETGHPATITVRRGALLWKAAATLTPGTAERGWDDCEAALRAHIRNVRPWREATLWGCLLAWHAPSGHAGFPQEKTWADPRIPAVQGALWCWAVGLCTAPDEAGDAWHQGRAARRQARAARRQVSAARDRCAAAGLQYLATWDQIHALESQACAAWHLANAAWHLEYAARLWPGAAKNQDLAVERQSGTTEARSWRFAQWLWRLVTDPQ
jgi:hypothetical protein